MLTASFADISLLSLLRTTQAPEPPGQGLFPCRSARPISPIKNAQSKSSGRFLFDTSAAGQSLYLTDAQRRLLVR